MSLLLCFVLDVVHALRIRTVEGWFWWGSVEEEELSVKVVDAQANGNVPSEGVTVVFEILIY